MCEALRYNVCVYIGVIRERQFSSSTARILMARLTRKVQKYKYQRIYGYKSTNTDTLLPDRQLPGIYWYKSRNTVTLLTRQLPGQAGACQYLYFCTRQLPAHLLVQKYTY